MLIIAPGGATGKRILSLIADGTIPRYEDRKTAVNLSCLNCRSIQPFSGAPLKCDVCGWVSGTRAKLGESKPYKPKKTFGERVQDAIGTVIKIAVVGVLLFAVVHWLTPEKQQLAEEYHVQQNAVVIEPKPHGCDFGDAPLGNKHCHYEKIISAPKDCDGPDCRVQAVYVSWQKISD